MVNRNFQKRRQEIGNKEKIDRLKYTLALKPLLKRWIKELEKQKRCPICGEDMPETYHEHHIDGNHGNRSSSNLVYICASCHAITYKAKRQLRELLEKRHDKWLRRKNRSRKARETGKGRGYWGKKSVIRVKE